jgi:hypothetical protein
VAGCGFGSFTGQSSTSTSSSSDTASAATVAWTSTRGTRTSVVLPAAPWRLACAHPVGGPA